MERNVLYYYSRIFEASTSQTSKDNRLADSKGGWTADVLSHLLPEICRSCRLMPGISCQREGGLSCRPSIGTRDKFFCCSIPLGSLEDIS